MPDENRRQGDHARQALEKKITDLAIGVVGMKGAMEGLARALQVEVDDLKDQLDRQRRLAKYARRTWFEVMAWIFLAGLLISDLARDYCLVLPGQESAMYPRTCNTIFWATEHGAGWGWRLFGFGLTGALLLWLARRSQVPDDLFQDTPAAQVKRERRLFRRRS